MMTIDDYRRWLESFRQLGLPAISVDTSAKVLAAVHSLGNNEQMVLSPQLRADLEYMQKVFGIDGGETPKPEIIEPLKHYIDEIENSDTVPGWAEKLFKERYGIKIYK